ncbi:Ubiquitin-like-specific protease ESD4 [Platanthera guangdongensis]|uniref:Ubiquitin-like-specific protease ESD4 n=1 Tax=Platanthera guangdongensis TaxID=2320717 RepID=A0ABR2MQU6_9ASPA
MGCFFSKPFERKETITLEEYEKLVKVHSSAIDNTARKVIRKPFTQERSGLAILTQKKDRGDSLSVLNKKVHDAKRVTLQSMPHDPKLKALDFQVKLKDDNEELFHPLKIEEAKYVSHGFYGGYSYEILITHEPSNIEISRKDLQCLMPRGWLNDEVINLYLELLKERERSEPNKFLKCHFFNTFFYKKLTSGLSGYDFRTVRRWTMKNKLGYTLIERDKVFVPIHKDMHWCLVVINIKDKSFQYLDSFGCMDIHALQILERYLMEETQDKCDKEIDTTSWKKESVNDLPLQKNGWDCGMFMIKYIDFYSRGLKLSFSQDHMPYFRKRTALEILRLRAD